MEEQDGSLTKNPSPAPAAGPAAIAAVAPEGTLRDTQHAIDQWIRGTKAGYFSELTNMAVLTEEVGEVARIISRTYGEQTFKSSDLGLNLADELADVLWVVCCLANQTGIDLTTALENNFQKKNVRDTGRHDG